MELLISTTSATVLESSTIRVEARNAYYVDDFAIVGFADEGPPAGEECENMLVFLPGETTQSIPIDIIDDTFDESDETVLVTLSGVQNAFLCTDAEHELTILDNDGTAAYTATILVEGQGSVALDPPGGAYGNGDLVRLTPTAATGWAEAAVAGESNA